MPPSKMRSNVSAQALARIFYFATRFFIPPFVLGKIGIQAYGLYGTIFVVVAYCGMSAIGFSNAYVKYVADFAARDREEDANRLLSSGFTVMTGISIVGFAIFALLWSHIESWIKVPPPLLPDARELAFLIVGVFFAYLALSVFRDALTGLQEIATVQKIWMGSVLLETVLIFALVGLGFGLRGLGIAFCARIGFEVGVNAFVCRKKIPWMRVRFVRPDRASMHLLASFGGMVQANCMMAIFLSSVERVIATPLLGLAASAMMDLGKRFPGMATSIPSSFASAVLPAASDVHARAKSDAHSKTQINSLYLTTNRSMNIISSLLFAFLTFAAAPCLVFWLKDVPAGVVALTVIFTLGTHTNMMTGPGTSILKAIGHPEMELHNNIGNCVALLAFVPLSYLVWGKWTVIGIAAGVTLANAASSFWFLYRAHRMLNVSFAVFWREVVFPGLVPYAVAAVCLLPISRWASSGGRIRAAEGLAIFGPIYLIATLVALFFLCATKSERQSAIGMAGRFADKIGLRGVEVRLARLLPSGTESI